MTLAHGSLRSPPFTLLKGVPQGCCLSPLLFLIFINDLPTFVQRTCPSSSPFFDFLLFADDIAIIPKTFLTDTQWPVHLQQVLEAVFCWTRSWKLTINAKKSALLLFCNLVNRPRPPCLLIGFDLLPLHSTYKYLGVTFSDDARSLRETSPLHRKLNPQPLSIVLASPSSPFARSTRPRLPSAHLLENHLRSPDPLLH